MGTIQYVGEHLMPGRVGTFFIFLSFVFGLISLFLYAANMRKEKANLFPSRMAFLLHTLSIIVVGATLLYIIVSHYFEYSYVFRYSSKLLPHKYIISSFWAGQEGSYLIWAIFIAVFGVIAMYTSRRLEAPLMFIVSLTQLFLLLMILGVKIFGIELGTNPFILLRDVPENAGLDFFKIPDYITLIEDGNGLNPLLENPWMVIHPPMLFLGYAAALIPFGLAFGSLVRKDVREWIKPTLVWLLVTLILLGAGILLGGAWAYQSLTFGGFWAWDPVENASLIPWVVLVAALHFMLLSYKRNKYYLATYITTFLGFLFVIYASYLTKSGVLGETSVHAFGSDSRSVLLVIFLLVFTAIPAFALYRNRKIFPESKSADFLSREFMVVYGLIVILVASFQIIATTSIPVFNKLIGTNMTPPSNVVQFYNSWQLPFALLAALLIGVAQYLHYGRNDQARFTRHLLIATGISAVLTAVIYFIDGQMQLTHILFLFSILFLIITSLVYLFKLVSKNVNLGGAITHLGFGIFLLGVLVAFSNTEVISAKGQTDGKTNVMLFKDNPKKMGDYELQFTGKQSERDETYYSIDFHKEGEKAFTLNPSIKYNSMMGNVHNPDTRNSLKGDTYMYLTYAEEPGKRTADGYSFATEKELTMHDVLEAGGTKFVLDTIIVQVHDSAMSHITLTSLFLNTDSAGVATQYPVKYELKDGVAETTDFNVGNSKVKFERISEKPHHVVVGVYDKQPEFVVAKILHFPYIWILWLGTLVMLVGSVIALIKRMQRMKSRESELISDEA